MSADNNNQSIAKDSTYLVEKPIRSISNDLKNPSLPIEAIRYWNRRLAKVTDSILLQDWEKINPTVR